MTLQEKSITVTLRSHLTPSVYIEGFELGKRCQVKLTGNITLKEFAQKVFFQYKNHIGIIAVNGIIAKETRILQEGDEVDIYSLMAGG